MQAAIGRCRGWPLRWGSSAVVPKGDFRGHPFLLFASSGSWWGLPPRRAPALGPESPARPRSMRPRAGAKRKSFSKVGSLCGKCHIWIERVSALPDDHQQCVADSESQPPIRRYNNLPANVDRLPISPKGGIDFRRMAADAVAEFHPVAPHARGFAHDRPSIDDAGRIAACGPAPCITRYSPPSPGLHRIATWTPISGAARRQPSSSTTAISSAVSRVSFTLPPMPTMMTGPVSGASDERP